MVHQVQDDLEQNQSIANQFKSAKGPMLFWHKACTEPHVAGTDKQQTKQGQKLHNGGVSCVKLHNGRITKNPDSHGKNQHGKIDKGNAKVY